MCLPATVRLLIAAGALIAAPAVFAQPLQEASPAENARCSVPAGFPNSQLLAAMRRGVNLPGWDHADPALRPTLAQLRATRDAGFTHIRLPIDEDALGSASAQPYLDAMMEQVILLLSLDFVVSLDLHAGGEIGRRYAGRSDEALETLIELWRQIAQAAVRFEPEQVAVELLNEPEFTQDDWMEIVDGLHAEVRRLLPDHTIIVGPSGPQRHETLAAMTPLDDRNMVYAVHYYDPFAFTHQGATWGADDDPVRQLANLPFPADRDDPEIGAQLERLRGDGRDEAADLLERSLSTPWGAASMEIAYDQMAEWAERNDRAVIVNEFGVLNFAVSEQSRLTWLALNSRLAEERCIGWTHWDFQDGFGMMDPESGLPDPKVVDALIPPRRR